MKARKPGFTLLELLFAIIVLGVMLSIVMTIVVGMLRFYTFANKIRENQQNGRNVLDTITREIRFGKLVLPTLADPLNKSVLCVADEKNKTLIRYNINTTDANIVRSQYSYANKDLSDVSSCDGSGGAVTVSSNRPVTGEDMTVTGFTINRTAGAPGTASDKATGLIIRLSYGTGSVNASGQCEPGDIYCSVLTYSTAVNNRGGGQ